MAERLRNDLRKMTGPQKVAVFLLTAGEEYSSEVFKKMTEEEIRKVAAAMAEIDEIPSDVISAVIEEFISHFKKEHIIVQSDMFIKNVIDKSLDEEKAKSIYREIEDKKLDLPFVWSRNVTTGALTDYLGGEHPQTIAMILAHMPPEVSAEVLMAMPDEKKGDLAIRIAQLGQIPEDIVREVEHALKDGLSDTRSIGNKAGGIQTLVEIMNNVDRATEDCIMGMIEEENEEMANDIKSMMFVFEDLLKLDDRGMREILKRVESQQLVLALKTSSDEMKQKIFGNLSSRAAEMLSEDLEVMGPVRLAEVEKAQQEIIAVAKELDAEGTIVLGGKGKEDILV